MHCIGSFDEVNQAPCTSTNIPRAWIRLLYQGLSHRIGIIKVPLSTRVEYVHTSDPTFTNIRIIIGSYSVGHCHILIISHPYHTLVSCIPIYRFHISLLENRFPYVSLISCYFCIVSISKNSIHNSSKKLGINHL